MMPVLLEEKRILFSSAEKDAPEIEVVARNCSIAYCFEGRPGGAAKTGAAKTRARPARPKRWEDIIDRSVLRERVYSGLTGVRSAARRRRSGMCACASAARGRRKQGEAGAEEHADDRHGPDVDQIGLSA